MAYYQGDEYSFCFKLEVDGNTMNLEDVELIEFTIGDLSKSWPLQINYDEENKVFLFPVTQEETFMFNTIEKYQARIKYINGNVYGTPVNRINVNKTLSRNVI